MSRVFSGNLIFAALVAGGSAFAVEAGPATDNAPVAQSSKQTANPKPKKRPVPLSAAFEATRTTELPAMPVQPRQSPSTKPTWSGTYVGVGAGGGADR